MVQQQQTMEGPFLETQAQVRESLTDIFRLKCQSSGGGTATDVGAIGDDLNTHASGDEASTGSDGDSAAATTVLHTIECVSPSKQNNNATCHEIPALMRTRGTGGKRSEAQFCGVRRKSSQFDVVGRRSVEVDVDRMTGMRASETISGNSRNSVDIDRSIHTSSTLMSARRGERFAGDASSKWAEIYLPRPTTSGGQPVHRGAVGRICAGSHKDAVTPVREASAGVCNKEEYELSDVSMGPLEDGTMACNCARGRRVSTVVPQSTLYSGMFARGMGIGAITGPKRNTIFPRVRSFKQLQHDVGAALSTWTHSIINWASASTWVGPQEGGMMERGEKAIVLGKVFWVLSQQQQKLLEQHRAQRQLHLQSSNSSSSCRITSPGVPCTMSDANEPSNSMISALKCGGGDETQTSEWYFEEAMCRSPCKNRSSYCSRHGYRKPHSCPQLRDASESTGATASLVPGKQQEFSRECNMICSGNHSGNKGGVLRHHRRNHEPPPLSIACVSSRADVVQQQLLNLVSGLARFTYRSGFAPLYRCCGERRRWGSIPVATGGREGAQKGGAKAADASDASSSSVETFFGGEHDWISITSDVGWGCTIRAAQMLLLQALRRHFLERGALGDLGLTVCDEKCGRCHSQVGINSDQLSDKDEGRMCDEHAIKACGGSLCVEAPELCAQCQESQGDDTSTLLSPHHRDSSSQSLPPMCVDNPRTEGEVLQWFLDVPSPPVLYPFSIYSFVRAAGGGIGWARELYGEMPLEKQLFGTAAEEVARCVSGSDPVGDGAECADASRSGETGVKEPEWASDRVRGGTSSGTPNPMERRGLGKLAGEWFGPTTASATIKLLVESMPQTKHQVYVYVNADGVVDGYEIDRQCRLPAPDPLSAIQSCGGMGVSSVVSCGILRRQRSEQSTTDRQDVVATAAPVERGLVVEHGSAGMQSDLIEEDEWEDVPSFRSPHSPLSQKRGTPSISVCTKSLPDACLTSSQQNRKCVVEGVASASSEGDGRCFVLPNTYTTGDCDENSLEIHTRSRQEVIPDCEKLPRQSHTVISMCNDPGNITVGRNLMTSSTSRETEKESAVVEEPADVYFHGSAEGCTGAVRTHRASEDGGQFTYANEDFVPGGIATDGGGVAMRPSVPRLLVRQLHSVHSDNRRIDTSHDGKSNNSEGSNTSAQLELELLQSLSSDSTRLGSRAEEKFTGVDLTATVAPAASVPKCGDSDVGRQSWRRACLLLFPLKVSSGDRVNQVYIQAIVAYLSLPWSLGMIAGRGQQAFYCLGCQGDCMLYLDPHCRIQAPAMELGITTQTSFFGCRPWKQSFCFLNASFSMAFYVGGRDDLDGLLSEIDRIERELAVSCLSVVQRPEEVSPSSRSAPFCICGAGDDPLGSSEASNNRDADLFVCSDRNRLQCDNEERGNLSEQHSHKCVNEDRLSDFTATRYSEAPRDTEASGHQGGVEQRESRLALRRHTCPSPLSPSLDPLVSSEGFVLLHTRGQCTSGPPSPRQSEILTARGLSSVFHLSTSPSDFSQLVSPSSNPAVPSLPEQYGGEYDSGGYTQATPVPTLTVPRRFPNDGLSQSGPTSALECPNTQLAISPIQHSLQFNMSVPCTVEDGTQTVRGLRSLWSLDAKDDYIRSSSPCNVGLPPPYSNTWGMPALKDLDAASATVDTYDELRRPSDEHHPQQIAQTGDHWQQAMCGEQQLQQVVSEQQRGHEETATRQLQTEVAAQRCDTQLCRSLPAVRLSRVCDESCGSCSGIAACSYCRNTSLIVLSRVSSGRTFADVCTCVEASSEEAASSTLEPDAASLGKPSTNNDIRASVVEAFGRGGPDESSEPKARFATVVQGQRLLDQRCYHWGCNSLRERGSGAKRSTSGMCTDASRRSVVRLPFTMPSSRRTRRVSSDVVRSDDGSIHGGVIVCAKDSIEASTSPDVDYSPYAVGSSSDLMICSCGRTSCVCVRHSDDTGATEDNGIRRRLRFKRQNVGMESLSDRHRTFEYVDGMYIRTPRASIAGWSTGCIRKTSAQNFTRCRRAEQALEKGAKRSYSSERWVVSSELEFQPSLLQQKMNEPSTREEKHKRDKRNATVDAAVRRHCSPVLRSAESDTESWTRGQCSDDRKCAYKRGDNRGDVSVMVEHVNKAGAPYQESENAELVCLRNRAVGDCMERWANRINGIIDASEQKSTPGTTDRGDSGANLVPPGDGDCSISLCSLGDWDEGAWRMLSVPRYSRAPNSDRRSHDTQIYPNHVPRHGVLECENGRAGCAGNDRWGAGCFLGLNNFQHSREFAESSQEQSDWFQMSRFCREQLQQQQQQRLEEIQEQCDHYREEMRRQQVRQQELREQQRDLQKRQQEQQQEMQELRRRHWWQGRTASSKDVGDARDTERSLCIIATDASSDLELVADRAGLDDSQESSGGVKSRSSGMNCGSDSSYTAYGSTAFDPSRMCPNQEAMVRQQSGPVDVEDQEWLKVARRRKGARRGLTSGSDIKCSPPLGPQ